MKRAFNKKNWKKKIKGKGVNRDSSKTSDGIIHQMEHQNLRTKDSLSGGGEHQQRPSTFLDHSILGKMRTRIRGNRGSLKQVAPEKGGGVVHRQWLKEMEIFWIGDKIGEGGKRKGVGTGVFIGDKLVGSQCRKTGEEGGGMT